VEDRALAVVEAEPHLPLLPLQLVAVPCEGDALLLGDLQRPEICAQPLVRDQPRHVLAHDLGLVDGEGILDLEELHLVQVDDAVEPVHGVGVRVAALLGPVPGVGPAKPQPLVLLGHEKVAIGPHLHEDLGDVGDPAPGERVHDTRVCAQRLVALVQLVDGQVRLLARLVPPGEHPILGERDDRLVRLAIVPVPADDGRLAGDRVTGPVGANGLLGRLLQLDGRQPPAVGDAPIAAQHHRHLAELLGRQGVEGMPGVGAGPLRHGRAHPAQSSM